MSQTGVIRTPDQRVRVFVSSALAELAEERRAVREAITRLRLVPVMFELGARPHPAREVYRAYLAQSQVFVGVYWQSYGWVAPGEQTSGLEDEFLQSAGLPRLIYIKSPAPQREPPLTEMLNRIRADGDIAYQHFSHASELAGLVENDLAVLLSERFEVAQAGERTDDPGAAAHEAMPPSALLPVPATSLIGRDHEVAAVQDLVGREGARLVTLTGPGGIGKSRLAFEAAHRLEPRFRDGVRLADLSSVQADRLVADAIAAALAVNTSGANLRRDLESYLRTRQLLLVLDNFEQVRAAAPLVSELLSAAPGLVVLVTSRTVLRLSGEYEFPVPALAVPDSDAVLDVTAMNSYPAVRLFVERASAVVPGFELTDVDAAAVAEICRRLDGLPLAIELAAAKTKLLPPRALVGRLGNAIALLTGGARDLPQRQQTLRNTLDWSFSLLGAREQALLARLGVFRGTFDLAAVEAVSVSDAQLTDTLGALVDSSLVRPQARDGAARFILLDTIREYALEHLHESGDEWRDAHERHAAHYVALAEPAAAELQDPGQLAWLRRLETEHRNLVAMMTWLVDQHPPVTALLMVWDTWRYWWLQGHVDELAELTELILANSTGLTPQEHALALVGAGFDDLARGELARGQMHFEESLPLFRQAGDRLYRSLAVAVVGYLHAMRQRSGDASDLLEESQSLLRQLDTEPLDRHDRVQQLMSNAYVYNFLGQIRLSQGDLQAATDLISQGLSVARRAPDRFTMLISLYNLGASTFAEGDRRGAANHLREGLSLAAETSDETTAAYYLRGLGEMGTPGDDPERAVHLLAAATGLLESKGSGWLHAFLPRENNSGDVLASLRSRLGDAAYETAWSFGRSMTGERAVEYALANGTSTSNSALVPDFPRCHGSRRESGVLAGSSGGRYWD